MKEIVRITSNKSILRILSSKFTLQEHSKEIAAFQQEDGYGTFCYSGPHVALDTFCRSRMRHALRAG